MYHPLVPYCCLSPVKSVVTVTSLSRGEAGKVILWKQCWIFISNQEDLFLTKKKSYHQFANFISWFFFKMNQRIRLLIFHIFSTLTFSWMGLLGWVSCLIVPTQKVCAICKIKQQKSTKNKPVQKLSGEINYVLQRENMIFFLLKKALKVLYWDIKPQ